MNRLRECDLKQLLLIGKKIHLFESGKLEIFDLVKDLNALLNTLESVSNSWKDDFQIETNTLEMIHDGIKDGSILKWDGDFKEDLHKSISKIKKLSTSVVEDYLKYPDKNILEHAIKANSDWLICTKCNDAWEFISSNAMVICPKCNQVLHNPRYIKSK